MNILKLLFALCLVVVANVAPTLSACAFSEVSTAARMECCCETISYDECSVSQGSCCSADEHHDSATPSTAARTVPAPLTEPPALEVLHCAAVDHTSTLGSIESKRRPLHLASNKVWLEKRLLLI